MKKIWARKAKSFKEAAKFEEEYYLKMPAKKRLEIMQFLRSVYYNLKHEDRERLRRVIKIIQ